MTASETSGPVQGLAARLDALFQIRPGERATALWLFVLCFFVIAGVYVVGRTLGTTLFLHRVDPAYLPYTYGVSAIGVAIASSLYALVADRFRRDHLLAGSALVFAALSLALRFSLRNELWFLALLYVFFDVVGDLLTIQLWTLASDLFNARQGKRLFGLVAAGGTIGGILAGALLGATLSEMGTENLFYVVAACLALVALPALRLGRLHDLRQTTAPPKRKKASSVAVINESYARAFAAMLAMGVLVTIIVDYQWKLAAREAFLGNEDGLAAYFCYFTLVTNGLTLFVQLFVTSRVLERLGLKFGLAALPAGLMAALAGMAAAMSGTLFFVGATFTKGFASITQYSLHHASSLVLYRPIPAHQRGRAKAFIGGVVKPTAAGLGGLLVAALTLWCSPWQLSVITLVLAGFWVLSALGMKNRYVDKLAASLGGYASLEAESLTSDKHTSRILLEALASEDRRRVLNALGLMSNMDALGLTFPLGRFLDGDDLELGELALDVIVRHGFGEMEANTEETSELGPLLVMQVERAIRHKAPSIRARAVAAGLLHGDLALVLNAAAALHKMIESGEAAHRAAAAFTLGVVGQERFCAPLITLLEDPEFEVAYAAVQASLRVGHATFAPVLARRLRDPRLNRLAAEALARLGDEAVPWLAAALESSSESRFVIDALATIGSAAALDVLACQVAGSDTQHAAYAVNTLGALALDAPAAVARALFAHTGGNAGIEALIDAELACAQQRDTVQRELGTCTDALLGDALRRRRRTAAEHTLRLLSLLHPSAAFDVAVRSLFVADGGKRADAVELLDNLPLGRWRPALVQLLDDPPHRPAPTQRRAHLTTLLHDPDGWVVCCAIYELALDHTLDAFEAECAYLDEHKTPLVQETVLAWRRGELKRRVQRPSLWDLAPAD